MIAWLSTAPSPQFVAVLNRLALARPDLKVVARYSDLSDRGRGWGDLAVDHPHSVTPSGRVVAFLSGLWCGVARNTRALVVLGYADPFRAGALLGARISRKRVFTLSDSSMRHEMRRPACRRLLKHLALRILFGPRATAWTISKENAGYWRYYGLRHQEHVPFESPVPVSEDATSEAARIRQETLMAGEKLVLCVARVSPEKGIPVAVDAIRLLRRRGVAARLVVVGASAPGYAPPEDPSVTYRGPMARSEIAAAFLAADVCVLCSLVEPYGLVVREALQFGLPVVASEAVASASWLCDVGWNIVPTGDSDATADAVERALSDGKWVPSPPVDVAAFYLDQLSDLV